MLLVNEKVSFQGRKFLSFRPVNEQYQLELTRKLLRVLCREKLRKLFTPGWYRVNLRVSQTVLIHNQNLFLIVSACLAGLQKFLKGKSDA